MQFLRISKKSGGFREIAAPSKSEKAELRSFLPIINALCNKYCNPNIVHGFSNNRSPVTNADLHRNKIFTFVIDIKDFFDSVAPEMIEEYLDVYFFGLLEPLKINKFEFLDKVFINNPSIVRAEGDNSARQRRAFQGLPTSPGIANLAASKMHGAIRDLCDKLSVEYNDKIIFTAYADDFCFSMNKRVIYEKLKELIPTMMASHGFEVNESKTRLMSARYGRHVTGINVDKKLRANKNQRKTIRLLTHKLTKKKDKYDNIKILEMKRELNALNNWVKLTRPKKSIIHQIRVLLSAFNLIKARHVTAYNASPDQFKDGNYNYYRLFNLKGISSSITVNHIITEIKKDGITNYDLKSLREYLYKQNIITPKTIRELSEKIEKDNFDNNVNENNLDIKLLIKNTFGQYNSVNIYDVLPF